MPDPTGEPWKCPVDPDGSGLDCDQEKADLAKECADCAAAAAAANANPNCPYTICDATDAGQCAYCEQGQGPGTKKCSYYVINGVTTPIGYVWDPNSYTAYKDKKMHLGDQCELVSVEGPSEASCCDTSTAVA
jgi:hypothetical protein